MLKKISVLALAGVLTLPAAALAADAGLEAKIEALSKQLSELKAQMEANKQEQEKKNATIEESAVSWNHAARFNWSGDFRSRYDYFSRDRYQTANTQVTEKNDSLMTNRLRLNMYARALENVEFAGRLAMYKAWGMQNTPDTTAGPFGGFPAIDGNSGRQPSDNALLVDRAVVNWNNINDTNFWFSIGRRPTTDGPPSQLKMNEDQRLATPVSYMDWPFDGLTIGYAYDKLFNAIDLPGRIRFCYGRGFEAGLGNDQFNTIDDTDFLGISWDIYNQGDRFVYLQSYIAMDVFNYPDMDSSIVQALAPINPRDNIGDIYHTSALYKDKWENLNYFIAGAWSRSDPNSKGMFNDPVAMMMGGAPNTDSENGYSVYLGARYDIPKSQFKFGVEYNYGSEYWIGMSPGHDDMYASKLATRGHVYEVYGIYDLPGRAASWLGKAFIRVGYQHYRYDYTGSLDWNMRPYDLDSATDRAMVEALTAALDGPMAGFAPLMVDSADQVYVTFETKF